MASESLPIYCFQLLHRQAKWFLQTLVEIMKIVIESALVILEICQGKK